MWSFISKSISLVIDIDSCFLLLYDLHFTKSILTGYFICFITIVWKYYLYYTLYYESGLQYIMNLTALYYESGPELVILGTNLVAMARHGLILKDNEATGSGKVLKYLLDLPDTVNICFWW